MSKIALFCNGEAGNLSQIASMISASDTIICADGGFLHALRAGLIPAVLIGDLDSTLDPMGYPLDLSPYNLQVLRYPKNKDQTDLELALDYAVRVGKREVLIACAFGGRVDHFLANILLTTHSKYDALDIALTDGRQTGYLLRGPSSICLERSKDVTLSLIPLTARVSGVNTTGLKWELHDAVLEYGSSRSISNCFVEPLATILAREGCLLVVTDAT